MEGMATRPFLFERSFDSPVPLKEPDAKAAEAETEDEIAEPEPPPPPTFSEEEMAAARDEAHAAGRDEGRAEAASATEARIAAAVEAVNERLSALFQGQADENTRTVQTALEVNRAVARKVLPAHCRRHALEELEHLLTTTFERLIDEPVVTVHVAPGMADPINERLGTAAGRNAYQGELRVVGDDQLDDGDCRIDWRNGGAERRTSALLEQIDDLIGAHLATLVPPEHTGDEPATDGPTGDEDE